MLRDALRAVAVIAMVMALPACSAEPGAGTPTYSDLDREATPADVLPADLPPDTSEDYVEDSVRFVGELDGAEYFLARWNQNEGACVVGYRSAEDWIAGCGWGGTITVTLRGWGVTMVPDGADPPESGTSVGANLVVSVIS
jgi:hypothetical protein